MALQPGDKLGPYEIMAPIGKGGMGAVYKARDTRIDRIVALKVSTAQFGERFEREARAIGALNHSNICTLHDVGPNYLVMEYVEGAPLKGPLPLDQALKYAAQICDALDAAHKKGITHRDLKPANILVTKAGIKLLDFGLAKLGTSGIGQAPKPDDATLTMALTGKNEIVGTLYYMSPEQLQAQANGQEIDGRSDIFSFGLVLYEMLTGKRAFEGSSPASVIAAIMERPAPSIATIAPPALDRLLQRCLAKDPDDRWQSARDLKADLEWIASAPESGNAVTVTPDSRSRFGNLPWIAAAVLAVGLIGVSWVAWRAMRPVETTQQPVVRLDLDLGPDVSLGSAIGPAVILSPDGTRLLFVSQGSDGARHLFTRRLDEPKAAQLSGTEGAYAPFFSPDGQWAGFFARGKLEKTRVDGGEPVSLCDAPAGRGASWGDDGNIIAALDAQAALSQVPSEGGKVIPVTELGPGEVSHRWPQVLPGGEGVLFNASTAYGNYDEAEISVVSLKDHRRKIVIGHGGMYPRYLPSGHLVYVTKGSAVAVRFDLDLLQTLGQATVLEEVSSNATFGFAQIDFSRNGTIAYRKGRTLALSTLQWLDGAAKTESLGTQPAAYLFPRLSPDGSRLAVMVQEGSTSDIWIYDLQRGNKARLTTGIVAAYPAWSSDGRFVVFQSAGGMFWTRADGAGKPQPLTQSKTLQAPNFFTPDGTRLAFSELTPGAGAEIRTVPVERGAGQLQAGKPEFFVKTSTVNTYAAFSPDGRWLAYADAEAGSYEVYVRVFPDKGIKVQISNAGGMMPVWSRNGHELFYRTEDNRIMVANYIVKGGAFVADKPRVWFGKQLANLGVSVNFDLAPDGKHFVVLMPAEGAEPRETQNHVKIAVNFFDEIRRRVATGK